jgi:hypothetical protein
MEDEQQCIRTMEYYIAVKNVWVTDTVELMKQNQEVSYNMNIL